MGSMGVLGEGSVLQPIPGLWKQLDKLVTSLLQCSAGQAGQEIPVLLLKDHPPTGGLFFSKTTNTEINEYFKALTVSQPLKIGRGEGQGPQ